MITAPIVPKGEIGKGIKNGGVAGTLFHFACKKCPISCAIRMAITAPK